MTEAILTPHNGQTKDYVVCDTSGKKRHREPLVESDTVKGIRNDSAHVATEPVTTAPVKSATPAKSESPCTKGNVKGGQQHAEEADNPAQKAKRASSNIKYVPQKVLDAEVAKLEKLSRTARTGDSAALDELRHALDESYPHVWRRLADFQILIERKLIELVAPNDPLRTEAFRKRCSEFRHDLLEGDAGSLATKMAASRVVTCWMLTQYLELRTLESPKERWPMKDLELAEKRYQAAMRTFGESRKVDMHLQRLAKQNSQEDSNGRG